MGGERVNSTLWCYDADGLRKRTPASSVCGWHACWQAGRWAAATHGGWTESRPDRWRRYARGRLVARLRVAPKLCGPAPVFGRLVCPGPGVIKNSYT